MEMTKEMIEQARELKNADELIAFAKENGVDLTKEQAEEYYAKLHQTEELADDELDNVAGGYFRVPIRKYWGQLDNNG